MRATSSKPDKEKSETRTGAASTAPGMVSRCSRGLAGAFLKDRGIRPSLQRIRIFEILSSTKEHPSADSIHSILASEIPTLSRTTVYSTLDLFAEKGIAQRLALSGSELRYDADVSLHAHFRCRRCGAVADVPGLVVPAPPKRLRGFRVETAQYFLEGLCPDCP